VRRAGAGRLLRQREEPPDIRVGEYLADECEWSLTGESLLESIDRDAPCRTLSGGQWMRVRLARALGAGFLVLDEPTNDLDRTGRAALAEFLHRHEGGVLLISHDRECLVLCEEIFELSNRGLAKFTGGWSAYLEAKRDERQRLSAALERAKRERESAVADRHERRERQERRNRHGARAGKRGGVPRILLGARKRQAQATS